MDSEVAPVVDEVCELAETAAEEESHPSKKNRGRIPKRIHKSEREKMKREQLNELFLALADALGLSQQNNGKACVLGETTRLLKEMYTQIESLNRDHKALFSESQYVTVERDELRDENSALEAQIRKLQTEIEERMVHSKPDLNASPLEDLNTHFSTEPMLQQAPYANPIFVIPVCPDPHASKPTANVSKPQPRYPTLSDSWPAQLLGKRPDS